MRLSRLEINGFKSFAKRTELSFEPGITAIVGPNGCGKSNIADAVRWVLGEQSARVLRGLRMEDVIFNGTEQRKALPYCEVSLTFDNTDGKLPIEYAEVTVTRRAYRSGESEYQINKNACRLKDIGSLFRDTGIGKEGYSIIGQGKVDELLSGKLEDRRNAFEAAAGIMRYRVRKEEAERKLDNTRKNLLRLHDILAELESQVGPLETQSATARTYLRLRDELKDIEINLFLNQYDKLNDRLHALQETMAQLDVDIAREAALEESLSAQCSAEEEKERNANAAISALQNKLILLSAGVESDSGEAKLIKERLANSHAERERLMRECEAYKESYAALFQNAELLRSDASACTEKQGQCALSLRQAEELAGALDVEISDKETLLEAQKKSIIDAMNRLADARSNISRLNAIKDTLQRRLSDIAEEEKEIDAEDEKLARELSAAEAQYAEIKRENDAILEKKSGAIAMLNESNSRLKATQAAVITLERSMESARTRIKVLEEMKKAYEGYYTSVRSLLTDAIKDPALSSCIEGVVAELIHVPETYETAIEMALGSAMQNIVTPTEQDAKRVIEYLRKQQYGRATMLPISVMRPRLLSREEKELCQVNGFIGVASELVGFDEKYRGVFENLLGRTVIVEDLDAGIAINKRARSAFRIATLKGDIINPGGSMTGGSLQKREFSLLGRGREIEDLGIKAAIYLKDIEKNRQESDLCEAALTKANAALDAANEAVKGRAVELATQQEKLEIIKKYANESTAKRARLALEISQIHDNIADIDAQCQKAEADQAHIESGNVATQDDVRKTQAALLASKEKLAEAAKEVTTQKLACLSLEKEADALQKELCRTEEEIKKGAREQESRLKKLNNLQAQADSLLQSCQTVDSQIESERKALDKLTDQLHALETERDMHTASLREARVRREESSSAGAELRERRHRSELTESKAQMELNNMQDRIWADYELSYENALSLRRPIAITASHVRADEIRKEIRELGDVNVNAIEDYVNVKERFDTLTGQYEDLTKAEADLVELIGDLTHTMEGEFIVQFEKIRANFTQVFAQLFEGGRADILFSDKNDVLNCDIEIIAQPPGKKLQLLSLLSGGERALTAIALLFAIQKLKPTAFCILDEIETALDEMNVTNFAEYLKSYAQSTQFIVITHRKGSMEVSDSVYGVTMEEKGVSRIVSARLKEMAG